jgi:hypothetical protein
MLKPNASSAWVTAFSSERDCASAAAGAQASATAATGQHWRNREFIIVPF